MYDGCLTCACASSDAADAAACAVQASAAAACTMRRHTLSSRCSASAAILHIMRGFKVCAYIQNLINFHMRKAVSSCELRKKSLTQQGDEVAIICLAHCNSAAGQAAGKAFQTSTRDEI